MSKKPLKYESLPENDQIFMAGMYWTIVKIKPFLEKLGLYYDFKNTLNDVELTIINIIEEKNLENGKEEM